MHWGFGGGGGGGKVWGFSVYLGFGFTCRRGCNGGRAGVWTHNLAEALRRLLQSRHEILYAPAACSHTAAPVHTLQGYPSKPQSKSNSTTVMSMTAGICE